MPELPENNKASLIPCLSEKVEIHNFSNEKYLLANIDLGYRVLISQQAFQLLKLVNGNRTLKEIVQLYVLQAKRPMTIDVAYTLFYDKFAKFGFVEQQNFIVGKRKRSSYLILSFVFLKKQYSDFLIRRLTFLFYPKVLISNLIIVTGLIALTFIFYFPVILNSFNTLIFPNFIFCFFMFGISVLFHEIGHATACKYFGAQHGDIGVGFYLLRPVLFADVSDIWKLNPKQRIVVNIAGMYFETLFASILLLLYYITTNTDFLIIPASIFVSSLVNFNPLLRYDGYWILTDLLNVPNLRSTASKKTKLLIKRLFMKKINLSFSKKDYFLAFYGLISTIFIIFFLSSAILFSTSSVIYFPINLYNYLNDIIRGNTLFLFSDIYRFLLPLFFYLLFYKVLKKIFFQYVWKRKSSCPDIG
jgi:putative peptide zinc metalloprotease protein